MSQAWAVTRYGRSVRCPTYRASVAASFAKCAWRTSASILSRAALDADCASARSRRSPRGRKPDSRQSRRTSGMRARSMEMGQPGTEVSVRTGVA